MYRDTLCPAVRTVGPSSATDVPTLATTASEAGASPCIPKIGAATGIRSSFISSQENARLISEIVRNCCTSRFLSMIE